MVNADAEARAGLGRAPQVYLASASPRRGELLAQIGVGYERVSAPVDESVHPGEAPETFVLRIALAKARAGRAALDADGAGRGVEPGVVPVLGADTAVVVDGEVLGKPRDRDHGLQMLARLAGRDHWVLSAVALIGEREATRLSASRVSFRGLGGAECLAYWRTGEPRDKAGAYAIQGLGALFVAHLEGSYSGVMGLPLYETADLLYEFGIRPLGDNDTKSLGNHSAATDE